MNSTFSIHFLTFWLSATWTSILLRNVDCKINAVRVFYKNEKISFCLITHFNVTYFDTRRQIRST
jgi:hypothetical protein